MSFTPHPLSLPSFPLVGSHLVEASAGTGKTFTIAMLYVRLVLGSSQQGHGHPLGPLTPPQILVVTFTEAATKELRDRIRSTLSHAARYFRAAMNEGHESPDPSLDTLLGEYSDTQWAQCARRLELAAEWMDEAAVSTIHGWCNRMLREHAFDSQSPFQQELVTDTYELLAETARDYWRTYYYPLELTDMNTVLALWPSPEDLLQKVQSLLDAADDMPPALDPAECLAQCRKERDTRLHHLKQPWIQWSQDIKHLLDEAKDNKLINGTKLKSNNWSAWCQNLYDWASSDAAQLKLSDAAYTRLTPEGLSEVWKSGPVPQHPGFDALRTLRSELAQLPTPDADLMLHAACWIRRTMTSTMARQARMSFNDLLLRLDKALQGPNGARLAHVIRQQFPAAMIDEFQDTDPVQYRIFEHIYTIENNRQDTALILIGDPKQAIYAFRGADLFTYLKARRAVGNRIYTLGVNYRSTTQMVEAVNQCFSRSEHDLNTAGAFRLRTPGSLDNPIPFLATRAQGRRDTLRIQGQPVAGLELVALAPAHLSDSNRKATCTKEEYRQNMARACAYQVARLLALGQQGLAGFEHEQNSWSALRPNDMAILVNTGFEAQQVRQALDEVSIRSVYLSDNESVFKSRAASELYVWLQACAEPTHDRLLRAALATPTLGLSLHDLDALGSDEQRWESYLLQFQTYQTIWQRQGVLPMIRRLLLDFKCAARYVHTESTLAHEGERLMTDLLHLAELLQNASFQVDGEHALLRYMAEQMHDDTANADQRTLRLESDAERVKVVTVHKSKGLEYPLVFIPFACNYRAVKADQIPQFWHDEQGDMTFTLTPDDTTTAHADEERLGEDIRKMYVAMTRARHYTWLGLAPLADNSHSAIDYLLGTAGQQGDTYQHTLQTWDNNTSIRCVQPLLQAPDLPRAEQESVAHTRARRPKRAVREHWWIGSYSSIVTAGRGVEPAVLEDTAHSDTQLELMQIEEGTSSSGPYLSQADQPIHRFHKGAQAGSFLHELLEWTTRQDLKRITAAPRILRDHIARWCVVRGWQEWIDPLQEWVLRIITTPITLPNEASPAVCLADLTTLRPEMEFWLQADWLDITALDTTIRRHTLVDTPDRPPLRAQVLNGMLKGFMDLVFEHDGRYYVLDYKSNWLGPQDACYSHASLQEAIIKHRYDVQYCLYLFALHRFLRSRLQEAYSYDTHVGGAVYFFLRGLGHTSQGIFGERPPERLMIELDELFDGPAHTEPVAHGLWHEDI